MSKMILVRGLPGSGKSTLAYELAHYEYGCRYIEADQYFENEKGEYHFNRDLIHLAHKWCMNKVSDDLFAGCSVVVSNTFTNFEEMRPYFQMANDFGCELLVIECTGEFGNIHAVPEATLARMRDRWLSSEKLWEIGEGFQNLKTLRLGSYDGQYVQWEML